MMMHATPWAGSDGDGGTEACGGDDGRLSDQKRIVTDDR
jgi:hypothetical protein